MLTDGDVIGLVRENRGQEALTGIVHGYRRKVFGLAVALGGRGTFNDGLLTFAWIATAIGAAYLVYYAVEGRGAPSLTPRGSPPRESPSRESPLGEPASRLPAEPPARHDQPPPGA